MTRRKANQAPYPTQIAAYAGFDMRGNIAFGTIRKSREACASEIERTNPAVDGFPAPLRVMPIWIGLDLNTQLSMELPE